MIQIKHRSTGELSKEINAETFRGADLEGANLEGAKIYPGWKIVKED